VDLTGVRAVVTGASSGLGLETARSLARAGAEVTHAVRDTAAGEKAAEDIGGPAGCDGVHVAVLDLADRAAVTGVQGWHGPLHLLVFDDIHFERRGYDPQAAYAQSKTATSLFAVEATRRWGADGIVANAVNPGGVATGLQRHFTQKQRDYLAEAEAAGVFTYKTVQQGAATTLVAAVAPEFAHTGGHYLDDGREAYTVPDDAELFQHSHGVKQWAIDPGTAQKLWTVSLALIG
jgi:NAD(P)-dependent dehydrogenase (short-subunit alcohol dehydrogenase family)